MFKPLTPKTIEIVETKNGKLRGFKQREIYNFLGVEYGECKRWQTATPVRPWKGVVNALQFGNREFPTRDFTPWDSCGVAHEAYPYSEDCLNLNIWTTSIEKTAKKPVMVWIHGGGRGAWHCADLPIVFHNSDIYPENFHDGLLDGLEDAMCGSWVAFARRSDPNNEYLGVKWPAYKTGECATMIFDNTSEVKNDFDRELVNFRKEMTLKVNDKYTKFTQTVN